MHGFPAEVKAPFKATHVYEMTSAQVSELCCPQQAGCGRLGVLPKPTLSPDPSYRALCCFPWLFGILPGTFNREENVAVLPFTDGETEAPREQDTCARARGQFVECARVRLRARALSTALQLGMGSGGSSRWRARWAPRLEVGSGGTCSMAPTWSLTVQKGQCSRFQASWPNSDAGEAPSTPRNNTAVTGIATLAKER